MYKTPCLHLTQESGQSKKASEFNGVLEGTNTDSTPSDHQYWLMKAEPESRLEKGHDIKFSIDDLAAKTEPEPWDGMLFSVVLSKES